MNLLVDQLLRVETESGVEKMNLPALMAALARDEVQHFIGIQRHQEEAFHLFLCQLATIILARRGDASPVQCEDYWRSGLRQLAGEAGDDAWSLVVEDVSCPAFMQPPLPATEYAKLKPTAYTPDQLDLLPTAKNHDIKRSRALNPSPDLWVYALISLQTMSGFFGRGNPGISRMNSGFGNRPIVELVRRHTPGGRWQDAILRLLKHRQEVLSGPWNYNPQGFALIWLEQWDGSSSLKLSQLDPCYIEICRRVRLRGPGQIERADTAVSTANRIDARELNGVVGDGWLPVDVGTKDSDKNLGDKALTISSQGLTPEILRRLIFSVGIKNTALQKPLPDWEGDLWMNVSVLVRGKGTTDGFHESQVLIPAFVKPRLFGSAEQREQFAQLSKAGIEHAGIMQNRVLKPAVYLYLQGAPETESKRDTIQTWWNKFADRFRLLWEDQFFTWLWSCPDNFDQMDVLRQWTLQLRDFALQVLSDTEKIAPVHTGRRYRSISKMERRFWHALYHKNNFPLLKEG